MPVENMNEITVKNSKLITLPRIDDGIDGSISVAENFNPIPFAVKRVYYIYNLTNQKAIRGKHAHKKLEQALFCIHGSCETELDDGTLRQDITLDTPNTGLYLGVELWHTLKNFSNNCILLVLASDVYKKDDYIRDYDEFKKYINLRRRLRGGNGDH
jgi:dTDP-4-dehydrorhamnose 3,5-epimerase-like enzyme